MLGAQSVAESAILGDSYIQPNLGHGLRIWWAFYWPTTLIATVLTFVLGYGVRQIYQNSAFPAKILVRVLQIGPYVLNYLVAIFVMHYILGKTFRHFRLGLLSSGNPSSAQTLPRSLVRTLRVWWTYVWRTLVYSLLGMAFVIYPASWFVGMFRPGPEFSMVYFTVLGFLVNGAFSMFVIYSNILDEDMGDFRVSLLPREAPVGGPPALVSNPD
jgi:hypothetical protein